MTFVEVFNPSDGSICVDKCQRLATFLLKSEFSVDAVLSHDRGENEDVNSLIDFLGYD